MKLPRHEGVVRTTFSKADWTAQIELLCKQGNLSEAFCKLHASCLQGILIPSHTYKCLLQCCTLQKALAQGQALHAHILLSSPSLLAHLESTLLYMYAQCSCIEDARHVFDRMKNRATFVWNVLISAYTRNGDGKSAFELFDTMEQASTRQDEITIVSILSTCKVYGNLRLGRWVHVCAIKATCETYISVQDSLLVMYAHYGSLEDANFVFERMKSRDVVSWTLLIAGYTTHGQPQKALILCTQMESKGIQPDKVTYLSILQACSSLQNLERGRQAHRAVVLCGLEMEAFMASTLVDMYSKCGRVDEAEKLFEAMAVKDLVSWNSLIAGYTRQNRVEEAFKLYGKLGSKGLKPDNITFLTIINACSILGDARMCAYLHMQLVDDGLELDMQIMNSVLDMYGKCGCLEDAQKLFDHCPKKDVVSWTTIISGYAKQGLDNEAFKLLERMQKEGINPDKCTFVCVLKACASSKNLDQGRSIHAYAIQNGLELDAFMESALVDLYSKGGHLHDARYVFDSINKHDVVSWTAMLVGYAQHGCGKDALKLMEQMLHSAVKLNYVTLMGVLHACSHSGLVEEGHYLLDFMKEKGSVTKTVEHYACMIDLLTRAGCLEEAERLLVELPFEPSVSMWLALLRSCSAYGGNIGLAKRAAEHVLKLEPDNDAAFVLLSNMCAIGGGSVLGDGVINSDNYVLSTLAQDDLDKTMTTSRACA